MKNLFKLFGMITLVTVIGFSMNGCGGDGIDDTTSAKVNVINNSNSTVYVGLWRAADGPNAVAEHGAPISSGEDKTWILTDGRDYYLGTYSNNVTGMLTPSYIIRNSGTFTAEAGKTVKFTYGNSGFSRN